MVSTMVSLRGARSGFCTHPHACFLGRRPGEARETARVSDQIDFWAAKSSKKAQSGRIPRHVHLLGAFGHETGTQPPGVFLAVDPSAKSLTSCGFSGKPQLDFNQKVKVSSSNPIAVKIWTMKKGLWGPGALGLSRSSTAAALFVRTTASLGLSGLSCRLGPASAHPRLGPGPNDLVN